MSVLKGKVALVTGSSRGIGRAIALRLAQDGALVCVNYVNSKTGADDTVKRIRDAGGNAFAVQADVSKPDDIARLFAEFDQGVKAQGAAGLDILVNNAAVLGSSSIATVTAADIDHFFNANVKGPVLVTQKALERMRDGGRIINISSVVSQVAYPSVLVYAATKAAVNSLTRSLAAELGPRNITVNALAPGATDTDVMAGIPQEYRDSIAAGTALRRVGKPTDIAAVAAFLAGPDGGWITGQFVGAHGGMHL